MRPYVWSHGGYGGGTGGIIPGTRGYRLSFSGALRNSLDLMGFDEVEGKRKAFNRSDGRLYRLRGGRGVYFDDPSGHILEIMTVAETGS